MNTMRKRNIEMEYDFPKDLEVVSNVKNNRFDLVKAAKIILYKIFNFNKVNLTIAYNTKLLDQLSTKDIDLQAILINPIEDVFVLYMRENASIPDTVILAHEMWHLKQYKEKKLRMPNLQEVYWNNVKYDNSIAYEKRPWEKEALKEQYKLERKMKSFYFV